MSGEGLLGELFVEVGLKSKEFEEGLDHIKHKAEHWKNEMKVSLGGIGDAFTSLGLLVAGSAAAIATVFTVAVTEAVHEGLALGSMMARLSEKTGISTEALSGMKVAAEEAGVELGTIVRTVQILGRNVDVANDSSSAAAEAFKRLGISLHEIRQQTPDEALGTVADALNKVTDAGERTHLSQELLGRGALELSGYLRGGSKAMEQASETAKELGVSLSGFDAKQILEAEKALHDLKDILEGVALTITAELAPYIKEAAKELAHASSESGNFKDAIHNAVQSSLPIVGKLLDFFHGLRIEFLGLKAYFLDFSEAVNKGLAGVSTAIVYVADLVKNVGLALWETAKSGQAGFEVLWGALKLGVQEFVYFAEGQFADLLFGAADAMHYINKSVAKEMEGMALSMKNNSKDGAASSLEAFNMVADAAAMQGEKTAAAWKSVLDIDTSKSSVVQFFTDGAEEASRLASEAHDALAKSVAEPLPSTAINNFLSKVKEAIDKAKSDFSKEEHGKAKGEVADPEMSKGDKALLLAKSIAREQELEQVRQFLATQVELEQQAYEAKKAIIDHALEERAISVDTAGQMYVDLEYKHQIDSENAERQHQKELLDLQFQGYEEKTQGLGTALGQLSTLMNSHSRKMFEIGKAAALANAVVQTAQAAITGYNNGMTAGGPYAGPYLAAAYMAAAIAAGGVQIAAISSARFGGGGSAPSSSGGSVPSAASAGAGGDAGGGGQRGPAKQINIQLQGDSMYSPSAVRSLIDAINGQLGDGAVIGSLRAT